MWETDNACGVPLDVTLKKYVYREPNGFFIESGGQDGLFQSNTLIAEREFGWTGLLIEPASSVSDRDRLGCVGRARGRAKEELTGRAHDMVTAPSKVQGKPT